MQFSKIRTALICSFFGISSAALASAQIGVSSNNPQSADITSAGKTVYESFEGTLNFEEFGVILNAYSGTPQVEMIDVSLPGNGNVPVYARRGMYNPNSNNLVEHPVVYGAAICEYGEPDMRDQEDQFDPATGEYEGDLSEHYGTFFSIPGQKPVRLTPINNSGTTYSDDSVFESTADYGSADYYQAFCHGSPPANHYPGDTLSDSAVTMDVIAPNGTTYTFERAGTVSGTQAFDYERGQGRLRVSTITDVHGNTATYTYGTTGKNKDRVTQISSSDGRVISIDRSNESSFLDVVTTVTANGRTWTIGALIGTGSNRYRIVTLPNGQTWRYDYFGYDTYAFSSSSNPYCDMGPASLRITNPYGGNITLHFDPTAVWAPASSMRTRYGEIPAESTLGCGISRDSRQYADMSIHPAVTQIDVSDPVTSETYQYSISYQERWGELIPDGGPQFNLERTITYPDGTSTEYLYNSDARYEYVGSLIHSEKKASNGTVLARYEPTYARGARVVSPIGVDVGRSYRVSFSTTARERAAGPLLMTKRVVTIDGDTYTTDYSYNDDPASADYSYARPTSVSEYSDLPGADTRVTVATYETNKADWIIAQTKTITRNGKVFDDYQYNGLGEITQHDRFGTRIASYTYNTDGTLASARDALDRTTQFSNYKRGAAQLITRPDGEDISSVVDDNGWILQQTDAQNRTTVFDYDLIGRRTLINPPGTFPDTTISYVENAGTLQRIETTGSWRIRVNYDGLLRPYLTETVDLTNVADTVCTHVIHDALNRERFTATRGVDSSTNACRTHAEILTIEAVAVPYATSTMAYLSDNRTQVTDAEGHVTTTTASGYGAPDDGNPILIAQPEGVSTAMTYDIFGNLLTATQGDGTLTQTQSWVYDDRLRMCRHTTPETGSALYEYDNANQVIGIARGQAFGTDCPPLGQPLPVANTITNQYDVLGRVDLVSYGDGAPSVDIEYDLTGTVDHVIRGISRWDYTYNELDALTSETLTVDARTYQMNYTYDANGYMASSVLPDGQTVSYGPDGFGRPTRATIGSTDHASGVSYDIYGALTHLDYANGATLREGRNGRNQTVWRDVVSGSSAAISYTYDYDDNGRIISILDGVTAGYDRAFGYDGIGRLTSANGQWGAGAFNYDALGNIMSKTLGARTVEVDYNANNQVSRFRDTDEANVWQDVFHDARGNVIDNGFNSHGAATFVYDLSDQPVSIGGAHSGAFVYDGNYKRVKQTLNGETIYTVYNQAGQVAYRDNVTTGEATNYVRMGGRTVVRFKTGGTGGPETAYLHADHLGSPVAATDETGAILWAEHFTPYGENIPGPAANPDDEGFTGHIQDTDTGLTYMQARYYDPVIGRFLSNDPVGFEEGGVAYFNRYAYTANDPVNAIDPNGEAIFLVNLVRGGLKKVGEVSFEQAVRLRRQGQNVLADSKQSARQIERAAADEAADVLRHKPHRLQDGSDNLGRPHYQNNTRKGHTFWGALGAISLTDLLLNTVDVIAFEVVFPAGGEIGCGTRDCNLDGIDDATGQSMRSNGTNFVEQRGMDFDYTNSSAEPNYRIRGSGEVVDCSNDPVRCHATYE